MGFRSKVNDRVEFALEYFVHCLLVGNVAAYEMIAGILGNIRQTFYVTRVGKLVEVEEFDIAADLQQIADKIRTDKAGSAGAIERQDGGLEFIRRSLEVGGMDG